MERYLVDSQIAQTVSELDGVLKLIKPHVKASTKVVNVDGEYKAVILDEDGTTRYTSSGEPMTIKEYVESLRDDADFSHAFKTKAKSGTGQQAGNAGRAGVAPVKGFNRFSMTQAQKDQYITQYGIAAYNKLPK
jgi:hypothetical protein